MTEAVQRRADAVPDRASLPVVAIQPAREPIRITTLRTVGAFGAICALLI